MYCTTQPDVVTLVFWHACRYSAITGTAGTHVSIESVFMATQRCDAPTAAIYRVPGFMTQQAEYTRSESLQHRFRMVELLSSLFTSTISMNLRINAPMATDHSSVIHVEHTNQL
jgi:hypothetical protein